MPEFRAYYCGRLATYMNTIFSDTKMVPQVGTLYNAIKQDGLRDWRKLGWEQSDLLTDSPNVFTAFISARREFLAGEMATFCPGN